MVAPKPECTRLDCTVAKFFDAAGLQTIDDKVGPLGNVDFVRITQTYFYFGYRMAVAKVVR